MHQVGLLENNISNHPTGLNLFQKKHSKNPHKLIFMLHILANKIFTSQGLDLNQYICQSMNVNFHYATMNTIHGIHVVSMYAPTMDFLVFLYELTMSLLYSWMDLPLTFWHSCMDFWTYYKYFFLHFCMVLEDTSLVNIPWTFSVLVFLYEVSPS